MPLLLLLLLLLLLQVVGRERTVPSPMEVRWRARGVTGGKPGMCLKQQQNEARRRACVCMLN